VGLSNRDLLTKEKLGSVSYPVYKRMATATGRGLLLWRRRS